MTITYELRTTRNAPVFSFDSLMRAREERNRYEIKIGIPLHIVQITHTEKVIE